MNEYPNSTVLVEFTVDERRLTTNPVEVIEEWLEIASANNIYTYMPRNVSYEIVDLNKYELRFK